MAYYSKDKNGNPRRGKNVDDLLDKIEESGITNSTITIGSESITPITEHQDVSGKVDRAELAEVAFTGDYDDLNDKPVIPSLDGYATEQWVEDKHYLTEHQSLDGYATEQWVGQQGFITSQAIEGKEDIANKKTTITGNESSNTYYPTTKAVADYAQKNMEIVAASGTALSAAINTYYNFASEVGTMAITFPAVTDTTHISNIVFMLTTGSTPAVTFTAPSGINVIAQDGFSIEASTTYEINAIFNGTMWVVAAMKLNTTDIQPSNP